MRDEIQRLLSEIEGACGTPELTDEEIEEIKEFWREVLRRACVLNPVGYKPMWVEIPRGKILTDLYKHEKWEIRRQSNDTDKIRTR